MPFAQFSILNPIKFTDQSVSLLENIPNARQPTKRAIRISGNPKYLY